MAFKGTVSSIPEMLVSARGNQTLVAELLGASRGTIRKYARDFKAEHHAIVNGTLMINRGHLGEHKRIKA
ncbi:protein ninH [Erwinia sp. E_sp_B01_1]|uniref:protein ninH n=1 Tax=Erwinia sp. E_sp_B01_1 TaxID=3039401 RepID=UPI0030CB5D2F